eukprot:TRINITY_DN9469_c0_g1_i1.p2 TRINITY_DN9469_c0_g1~~TRINITY_DN9469_c0_g1_i1.p2  ORF type:complete len:169 (+),score=60.64 TRINITY_DN9469_c0_g1_i1:645-1151(+)
MRAIELVDDSALPAQRGPYVLSKAMQYVYARQCARSHRTVLVNAVCPGAINSKLCLGAAQRPLAVAALSVLQLAGFRHIRGPEQVGWVAASRLRNPAGTWMSHHPHGMFFFDGLSPARFSVTLDSDDTPQSAAGADGYHKYTDAVQQQTASRPPAGLLSTVRSWLAGE